MYPILPWILCDYSSDILDFTRFDIFRPLDKPMGALNEERLQLLKSRYHPPEQSLIGHYLYSSTYSAPLSLFNWMIRVEPFTSLHIQAQSGRFDLPTRLFTSIKGAYDLASSVIGDYRELPPEFFFDHLVLLNRNEFDLGKVRGQKLNDVDLPPWCHLNALEFVYLMRKALESDYISNNLASWIDLIWGIKQKGNLARECNNIFYPFLYEDVWSVLGKDLEKGPEIKASLETCGQIPQQLFVDFHPSKNSLSTREFLSKSTLLQCDLEGLTILSTRGKKLICRDTNSVYIIHLKFRKTDLSTRPKLWKKFSDANLIVASMNSICTVLKNGDFLFYNNSLSKPIQADIGKATCLAIDDQIVCIGGSNTSIALIQKGVTVQTFSSFRDRIFCCACNADFDLVVVGASSTLFLISTSRRSITRVITLEEVDPMLVEITKGWGFIVVYEVGLKSLFIEVLTVNGDFVRKVKLRDPIDSWSTWCSNDCFDYLIYYPKQGKIRICEVFWLNFSYVPQIVYGAKSVVYLPKLECIFVGQLDGHILMIPHKVSGEVHR
jgi:hypothetical protein